MIVPSMTLPEIKASVFKDYETELRNKMNSLKVMKGRKWQQNGGRDSLETIHYPAKSKNDWRITVESTAFAVSCLPYLISYNNIGITASYLCFAFDKIDFMHFNTHFFQRYKERLKLDIEKPEELVKTFFKKNRHLFPSYFNMEDGSKQLFVPLNGGVGLGIYHPADDIYEFKTFVDNSLLKESQQKRVAETTFGALNKLAGLMGLPFPELKV